MIKIDMMTNVTWEKSPKVIATCTINVDGFGIKECKAIEGENGIFVVSPSKKLNKPYEKNGKMVYYDDIVWFPQEHREELNTLVSTHYDSSQPDYKPYDGNGNPVTFGKKPQTADEEIPF